jgi:putative peptide zinc metalloprotease protein
VDAESVYVTVPGFVVETKQPGDKVREGETIAQLRNPEITLAAERALGERDRQSLHLKNLKSQAIRSSEAAEQIPAAEAALVDREEQLQQRLADVQRLKITALVDGVVLSPPTENESPETPGLPSWQGSPLDLHNRNAFLETGTPVCLIGDPKKLEGVAILDQQDVDLVAPAQRAALSLDLQPGKHFTGTLTEISPSRVDELPQELAEAKDLPQWTQSDGKPKPIEKVYQARIQLDDASAPLLSGATGTVKIYVRPRSIAATIARFLQSTFRVEW